MTAEAARERSFADVDPSRTLGERFATVLAWGVLLAVDGLTRTGGFPRVHRLVRAVPVRSTRREKPASDLAETARRIAEAVDRASTLYFRRAWCLQRSVATVCWMRWRGLPAQLVIGIHRLPFYAHAWAEIEGRVVNDDPVVRALYVEIERC